MLHKVVGLVSGTLIVRDHDDLYPLKFIINEAVELKFPKRRVVTLLEEMGFRIIGKYVYREKIIELRLNTHRAFLTERELLFSEDLPTRAKDSLQANLYSLLVQRITILNQAAHQNAEAAKINLLQSQRRASVSDAYYAIFTAFGSLIEYTKHNYSAIFNDVTEGSFDVDPEDKRNHFTPEEASKIQNRILGIVSDVQSKLVNINERVLSFNFENNLSLSRTNSFVWVIITICFLFENFGSENQTGLATDEVDEINEESPNENLEGKDERLDSDAMGQFMNEGFAVNFATLLDSLTELINSVNIESFAIGVSGREGFEENFSEVFNLLRADANRSDSELVKSCSVVCLFFLYTYALRQMADYEVSFDSRINIEQIAELCHCTDIFVKSVSLFTEKNKQELCKIQRINSQCSPNIINNYQRYSDTEQSIFFIGGIATRAKIDIAKTAKYILKNSAYRPVIINGVIYNNQDGNSVVVERKLTFLPVNLRIIISDAGSFWVEVVVGTALSVRKRMPQEYVQRLNQNAVEKFIVDYIIPYEVLPAIGSYDVVYVGSMGLAVEREYDIFGSFTDIYNMGGVTRSITQKVVATLEKVVDGSTISNSIIVPYWLREIDEFGDIGRLFRYGSAKPENNHIVIIIPSAPVITAQYQIKEKVKALFAEKGLNLVDTVIVPYDLLGELITLDEIGVEERLESLSVEIIRRIEEQIKQEDAKETYHTVGGVNESEETPI